MKDETIILIAVGVVIVGGVAVYMLSKPSTVTPQYIPLQNYGMPSTGSIPANTFASQTVPSQTVPVQPSKDATTATQLPDGAAIKTATDATTYLMKGGIKYPIANEADFAKLTGHATWDYHIIVLTQDQLDQIPTGVFLNSL